MIFDLVKSIGENCLQRSSIIGPLLHLSTPYRCYCLQNLVSCLLLDNCLLNARGYEPTFLAGHRSRLVHYILDILVAEQSAGSNLLLFAVDVALSLPCLQFAHHNLSN